MGRYYKGDIEGKLWFAVQLSNAPERFGAYQIEKEQEYMIDDLEVAKTALNNIKDLIGEENIEKLNNFFENRNAYNDNDLMENGLLSIWTTFKVDYADYLLGEKIVDKIEEQGYCNIIVDL